MIIRAISMSACVLLMGVVLIFSGCGGEKGQAEFDISNLEYSIVQDGRFLYTVTVTGDIRNIGTADAREVVVTGGCPSCGSAYRQAEWHLTDTDKADEQKAVIRYLGKGERTNFAFKGLAFYSTGGSGEPPTEMPDELEVYVMSFESAD